MCFRHRLLALALVFAGPAAGEPLALQNVSVVDGTGSPPQEGRTVLISGGTIADVFATGTRALPEGTVVMDLPGHTIIPGLIDAHVHFLQAQDREGALRALLRSGVTTVRELAGDARISADLARRAANREIASPAIYYSAVFYGARFLEDARSQASAEGIEPGSAPWSRLVTPDSDLVQIIADARATGATGIKLYASLDPDMVAALTREAQRQGLKVWAHSAIFPAGADDAVAAGADSIIHAKGLITVGQDDIPGSFAEGTRAWMPARDFANIDPEESPFTELFQEMVRRGTILEPALMADGDLATRPLAPWRIAMRDWACRATGAAHRAGVIIGAGTDTRAQAGILHRELARLVECGLSPVEAIRAATLNNATAIGIEDTHGTIAPGKAADLVAVAGNPAHDIRATADIRIVVQGGRVIEVASGLE